MDSAAYMREFRKTHPEYREYMRNYAKKNAAIIYARRKVLRDSETPEQREIRLQKKRVSNKKQYSNPENREKRLALRKQYLKDNRERRLEIARKSARKCSYARHLRRMESDANYKIKFACAGRIRAALKRPNGGVKGGRTMDLIGCTIPELRAHIEKQFKSGMSWSNYGEWQIDHRIPCAEFDLRSEFQQLQCFNYANLQPLWKKENLEKKDKLTISYQPVLKL